MAASVLGFAPFACRLHRFSWSFVIPGADQSREGWHPSLPAAQFSEYEAEPNAGGLKQRI
jgi:hypothetical protein